MVVREVARIGSAGLWALQTRGVMTSVDLADGPAVVKRWGPSGLLVDHRQTLFALQVDDLVMSVRKGGLTPAVRIPIAYVLRPELLPMFALLAAVLAGRGLSRRCFLSRQDAAEWLALQAL